MRQTNDEWMADVQALLDSFGMPLKIWQKRWAFDFKAEYRARISACDAANKVNRFWWREQNRLLREDCRVSRDCWLPDDHEGRCQTVDGALITVNRKNGIVQKIVGSQGSFDQQYTTINGKTYWTWLQDARVKLGMRVEFTEKLNHRVGPRSNPVRADVADDVRPKPD